MAEQTNPLQQLISQQLRPFTLCLAHDILLAGHLGIEKTLWTRYYNAFIGLGFELRCRTIDKPASSVI